MLEQQASPRVMKKELEIIDDLSRALDFYYVCLRVRPYGANKAFSTQSNKLTFFFLTV